MTETQANPGNAPQEDPKQALLEAALPHVPFDGWSEATFRAAIADSGLSPGLGRAICPRGAVDLAVAQHKAGDAKMTDTLRADPMEGLRFRDKVARAVRLRIEAAGDREVVRRGSTLFALPHHAPEGARLIWGTADAIWNALGDTSDDLNWYSKRASLAGVYGSTLLYWLGDDSVDQRATWEFLDRRIGDVMQIETVKGRMRQNPLMARMMEVPNKLFSGIRRPQKPADMPGRWDTPR